MDPSLINPNAVGKTIAVVLVLAVVSVLLIGSRLTSSVAAWQQERAFENKIPKDVPIKLKIKQSKEVSFKDLQNEKWVSEFELEFTNTGDKPIYFLYLTMGTDVKVGGQEIVFPLSYGRAELGDIVTKATSDDVPIKPGETCVLTVGEADAWERGVREHRFSQANKFRAELQALSFGDGTGYFGNQPYMSAVAAQAPMRN